MTDPRRPLVVLDDDPTGTQAVTGVPVLLAWDTTLVREAVAHAPAVHMLTNSRAYSPERACELVRGAAATAVDALEGARPVLRGDSTLRAHLLEEYLALCEAAHAGRTPPLLLVPALPAAGRITLGGVHYLERDGRRTPLHETEYARDPAFAYRDARLLQWADDRSNGFFARERGREVPLAELRASGPDAVTRALDELADAGRAAVCVPDVESLDDLHTIARGLRRAERRGAEVAVRAAPTFVGVLSGALAVEPATPPPAGAGVLVVCGSYVPSTTRQLSVLVDANPDCFVEVDVHALQAVRRSAEIARAAEEASARLFHRRLAVVSTPRNQPEDLATFEAGQRVATGLAEIAGLVDPQPGVVLAKGGITSAVTARHGLGARKGHVLGPLVDGVALWRLERPGGATLPYVVFPGNVGADGTLLEVVRLILDA